MTSKEFQPASLIAIAGTMVVALLAVVWSSRGAIVVAGIALIALAAARAMLKGTGALEARSTRFDTLFLAVLGLMIVVLGIVTENI